MGSDIAAVYGVHGDEKTPTLLLDWLRNHDISVIGPVNPRAWAENKRCIDEDLNRVFDKPCTGYESTLKPRILQRLRAYETIIDLHSFRMRGNTMLLRVASHPMPSCESVWDARTSDISGTLTGYMAREGKRCYPIELPAVKAVSQRHLDTAKKIILDVQAHCFTDATQPFKRTVIDAPRPGLFKPYVDIGDQVAEGDIVGCIQGTDITVVNAPRTGRIGQVQLARTVSADESLCGIQNRD